MPFRNITATAGGTGQVLVQFDCTVQNAVSVAVNFGADSNYGNFQDGGSAVAGPDAEGYVTYQVGLATTAATFHYACAVSNANRESETSSDMVYTAPVAGGGGEDGDGDDHEHGRGRGRGHEEHGNGRGRGHDDRGHGRDNG
jgi:hypothetical protein